jgi:hypothetical protein
VWGAEQLVEYGPSQRARTEASSPLPAREGQATSWSRATKVSGRKKVPDSPACGSLDRTVESEFGRTRTSIPLSNRNATYSGVAPALLNVQSTAEMIPKRIVLTRSPT